MFAFSLKRAYFFVSCIITAFILIGGFTIIVMNNDIDNVSWARELIAMIVMLWVPSPGEELREMIHERRQDRRDEESEIDDD